MVAVSSRQVLYQGGSNEVTAIDGVDLRVAPSSPRERRRRTVRPFSIDGVNLTRWLDDFVASAKPDLIHVHWGSAIGTAAADVADRHRLPLVAEVRFDLAGAMTSESLNGRLARLEPTLRRVFERHLRRATAVVAASYSLAELVARQTDLAVTTIPNGAPDPSPVDPESVDALRRELGVAEDVVLVGAVSKMLHYEGFDRLLSATARLRREGHEVRPVLVGDGPRLAALRSEAAELGIDLISPGAVDRSQVDLWWNVIDVVVIPRRSYTVTEAAAPLKLMEALAHHRPVVASSVGDVPAVLAAAGGMVVDPDDDGQLIDAMRQVIADPEERRARWVAAAAWTETAPRWPELATALAELYRRVTPHLNAPGGDPNALPPDEGENLLDATVVVPTYNRPQRLVQCLRALSAQVAPPGGFDVVVVDDGSDPPIDPRRLIAVVPDLDFRVIRQTNRGPAAARNRGAAVARGRVVLFTDDDCRPGRTWVSDCVVAVDADPDGLIGGSTVNGLPENPFSAASEDLIGWLHRQNGSHDAPPGFLASNNLACRLDRLVAVGGFDESFPTAAGEDRDLGARWAAEIGPLKVTGRATVEHFHDLDLSGFCRQHRNYGVAAATLAARRRRHRATGTPPSVAFAGPTVPSPVANTRVFGSLAFYRDLILHPLEAGLNLDTVRRTALLALSQVMVAVGFAAGLAGVLAGGLSGLSARRHRG